jgi:hypothetical protein
MREWYYKLSRWIGYIVVLRDYYDVETFTLRTKNSHLALLRYVGETDEQGWVKVEQVFQIQIKTI